MTPINKFIALTPVAALMIGTLVLASDQSYAKVTLIIGSDVGQQNNGDTATTFFP
jgi:phosphatidylserine decarboxylase